ncbi:hypothetical protein ACIRD6_29525 [Streptomyces sp. NPDC102473]|uniref:hypothetical protein n=1 Tax=Streptomyces sp. NPDC102473 TaxID=3366180 RepID=UPI0038244740
MSTDPTCAADASAAVRRPRLLDDCARAVQLWWIRRRVVRFAGRLDLRPDLGLQNMVDRIAAMRGQQITIAVVPLPRTTTGLCCFGRTTDTIIVYAEAEPLHRVLITLHELWHLIEDLSQPGLALRLWTRCVRPLERRGLLLPGRTTTFGDHSVFDVGHLPEVLDALPPDLVRAVLEERRPVRMRGEHNHGRDPAEVFARQMLQMLALDEDPRGTGSITSSFAHRRTGI